MNKTNEIMEKSEIVCFKYLGGSQILICTNDNMNIWDIEKNTRIQTLNFSASQVFLFNNHLFCKSVKDNCVSVFYLKTLSYVTKLNFNVECFDKAENGNLVCGVNTGYGHRISFYTFSGSHFRNVGKIENKNLKIDCIEVLSNGYLASSTSDNNIYIWNERRELHKTFVNHYKKVFTIKKLSNELLISGSLDNTIRIWNYVTGERTDLIFLSRITSPILILSNQCFACIDESKKLKFFEPGAQSPRKIIALDFNEVKAWEFFEDKFIAFQAEKGIQIYELTENLKRSLSELNANSSSKRLKI